MRTSSALVVLALLFGTGCGGGVKLTPIKTAYGRPSNVAVYFRVEDGKEPVGGLTADSFRIYEDDGLVSQFESKQTIINPEVAASHYTLLLVDLSGSVAESGSMGTLVDAATAFVDRVEKQHKVAVYGFTGSTELQPIAQFTSAGGAKAGLKGLASYKPQDPSTNLNGAIIKGLAELEDGLSHAEHPMRFGTLVVFSDGTDRAHRVKEEDMYKAIDDTKHDVFAIGLGPELSEAQLKKIGKAGTARADNKEDVVKAFDAIAQRIESRTKSYYMLSYCSPSRAGKHKVKVEAVVKTDKSEKKGSLQQDFDAQGFAQGCDPKSPPPFDITKGDALAPKEDKKDEKKDEKKGELKVDGKVEVKPPTVKVQGGASGGGQEQFNP